MASAVRQNFHEEVEAAINKQINMELYASYVYQSMAFYYDRADVAMPGFHNFFKKSSDEEREHAEKLMKYQNQRGGTIVLHDVKKPTIEQWASGLVAMKEALILEKKVNQSLLDLHAIGSKHIDSQFTDFIEGEFLKEQVDSIKDIADMISKLERSGPGLGEYLFDKELSS